MTPQQIKKLERLAKVLDNGDIELLTQLDQLETKTQQEIQEVIAVVEKALAIAEQTKKLKGEKGDKGDPGRDGRDGIDGKDGYTPIKGVDYFDGKDGRDGRDGKDGVSIKGEKGDKGDKGDPGADGFIDEATIAYLEDEIKRIEKKHGGYGQVVRKLRAGSNISIDDSNLEYPVINNTNPKITVSDTEPTSPSLGDIWIDTSI